MNSKFYPGAITKNTFCHDYNFNNVTAEQLNLYNFENKTIDIVRVSTKHQTQALPLCSFSQSNSARVEVRTQCFRAFSSQSQSSSVRPSFGESKSNNFWLSRSLSSEVPIKSKISSQL